jgi:hypothetical protein
MTSPQQRITVVGNGDIDADKPAPTRDSARPIIERVAVRDGNCDKPVQQKAEPQKNCGAMSQQRGDSGNESAPQKFVQLVGCSNPKVGRSHRSARHLRSGSDRSIFTG